MTHTGKEFAFGFYRALCLSFGFQQGYFIFLLLGDIAVAPHPAAHSIVDQHGQGSAFEHPAIFADKHIKHALMLGVKDFFHLAAGTFRIG